MLFARFLAPAVIKHKPSFCSGEGCSFLYGDASSAISSHFVMKAWWSSNSWASSCSVSLCLYQQFQRTSATPPGTMHAFVPVFSSSTTYLFVTERHPSTYARLLKKGIFSSTPDAKMRTRAHGCGAAGALLALVFPLGSAVVVPTRATSSSSLQECTGSTKLGLFFRCSTYQESLVPCKPQQARGRKSCGNMPAISPLSFANTNFSASSRSSHRMTSPNHLLQPRMV
mmetsp:Transcript_22633/g.57335  ORF Transcript_22633/g.57335 Transcript_22633/m.57335 type:complete len:227 (-) Transcript_22633:953-1633(-)